MTISLESIIPPERVILLDATTKEDALRRRHRDFFLRLALRFDADWCGPDQVVWRERLTRDHANLRAALDYSIGDPEDRQTGVRMAGALLYFWIACGHVREGRLYLDRALAREPEPGPDLTRALWVCAWTTAQQADMAAAAARLTGQAGRRR